jgi:hypothetical protein
VKPAVHRREIDERLEGRARLARRLDGAVELAAAVGPAAGHGEHAAGLRVHHDDAALDVGHLAQRIGPWRIGLGVGARRLLDLLDDDHVAHRHDVARAARRGADRLVLQGRASPGHLGERHGALAAVRQADELDRLRLDLADDRELPRRRTGERTTLDDPGKLLFPDAHVGNLGIGSAPAMTPVVG